MENALRVGAANVIRAARQQHPMLWERWSANEAALLPVSVPATRGGVPAGEVEVMLALDGLRAAVGFPGGGAAPLVVARVVRHLTWRWLCPRLRLPCIALFLPPGGERFLSRQGHGLRHRSVSENPMERAARRARKLRARLGEHPVVLGGPLPTPPPRMRWQTYGRLCDAIREAEEKVELATSLVRFRAFTPLRV